MVNIYSKKGDEGKTELLGGKMISKDHLIIEAIGTIDELNSLLGVVLSFIIHDNASDSRFNNFRDILRIIQNDLFNIGVEVASVLNETNLSIKAINSQDILKLEKSIDDIEKELIPLKYFILPGGCQHGAYLHLARSVCRRAERRIVSILSKENNININISIYLNRLSDLFFVSARWVNKHYNVSEHHWDKDV